MSRENIEEKREWYDVETINEKAWYQILSNIQAGIKSELCPSCHVSFLRFFYWRHGGLEKRSGGGSWFWCSSCRQFMHFSGVVPDWWIRIEGVPYLRLTPIPDWLEAHWTEIEPQIVAMER